jgi:hypothetical protein
MATKKSSSVFRSGLSQLSRGSLLGTTRDGLSSKTGATAINFGKPADKGTTTTSSGTDWTGMLKQASSSGLSSLLGGGLASGGIGSIISGISSLFGGGTKTPEPLKLFSLPDPQNYTVHLQGSTPAQSSSSSGVHVHVQTMDSQSFMSRSNDIARAVKTAMLNSHSINDVISEL